MANLEELSVALDIGTTKVVCLVGSVKPGGCVDIKGLGLATSRGLRNGRIIDIDQTVDAINQAVDQASDMSGADIAAAYVGIAGEHIVGRKFEGSVSIQTGTVTEYDIKRCVKNAMILGMSTSSEILAKVPMEYQIDDRTGIQNPVGMCGTALGVKLHVFSADHNALYDMVKCVEDADLAIQNVLLESIASAESVLYPAEKQQGVALIDIGGGTTDMAVFIKGSVHHVYEVGFAGDLLSYDLATGLRIPLETAGLLKETHGCCFPGLIPDDYVVELVGRDGQGDTRVDASAACSVLSGRVDELLGYLAADLAKSGLEDSVRNIVLTGGTSQLRGLPQKAVEFFNRPVRVGFPLNVSGLGDAVVSPIFSTAVGLLLYGLQDNDPLPLNGDGRKASPGFLARLGRKVRAVFTGAYVQEKTR
ncbi:MAG: cell division protein FtsA [Deltaproteobacteria bacterium]|jgi:cell division protein FtsA|nr:cell division protein FtsA [Deltaproteobacteria bacterium]